MWNRAVSPDFVSSCLLLCCCAAEEDEKEIETETEYSEREMISDRAVAWRPPQPRESSAVFPRTRSRTPSTPLFGLNFGTFSGRTSAFFRTYTQSVSSQQAQPAASAAMFQVGTPSTPCSGNVHLRPF